MQRRYITVDVFTDRAFGGNLLWRGPRCRLRFLQLRYQAVAREFNYSETTFVLPPADAAHDAQVRIFTRKPGLPFAGHPNVGTAFVLATRAEKMPARLLFEEIAGLVPVEIRSDQGKVVSAELTAPQPLRRSHVSAEQAAACLSLSAFDISTDRHAPQIVSVGTPFLVAEVASREALRRAKPDAAAFASAFPCDGADAISFYTRDVPAGESLRPAGADVSPRRQRPDGGSRHRQRYRGRRRIARRSRRHADGELKLRIGQGVDMGRPSLLLTRVQRRMARLFRRMSAAAA